MITTEWKIGIVGLAIWATVGSYLTKGK